MGLWARRFTGAMAGLCQQKVVSPVPYFPPLPGFARYRRFRNTDRHSQYRDIDIFYPRFILGPGRSLYNLEAAFYRLGVTNTVKRLHTDFQFNIIHAHFSYPDGVVAMWLSRRYRVPYLITEHALWTNWMGNNSFIRGLAVKAVNCSAYTIAATPALKDSISHFTKQSDNIKIIPNGVDAEEFSLSDNIRKAGTCRLLFVGFINHNKGVDILLHALSNLVRWNPDIHLTLIGDSLYAASDIEKNHVYHLAGKLGLESHLTFAGLKQPREVAQYMSESDVLILPSRRETFGSVIIEALACGIPVVATRCGGPEYILNEEVGLLVPKEDPEALANGIRHVLEHREKYKPETLHSYATKLYSWDIIARENYTLYEQALMANSHRK